jgi:type IV secretory pathway VirB10-like protein
MNGLWPMAISFEMLIAVLFVIISIVGSLANKWRQMQEEAARRNRPRPAARPQAQRPLDDEIAEFLRTAGERRGGAKPGTRPSSGPASAPPRPAAPARPAAAPRPTQLSPRPPVEPPLEVRPLETRHGSLGEPLTTRSLAAGDLGQLTTEVPQEEARLNEHLRTAFGHQLSTLGRQDMTGTAAAPSAGESLSATAAAGLAALLASGEGLRNAVILNEILNRPEHRWG